MSDVNVALPDGTPGTVPSSEVSKLPQGSRALSAPEVESAKTEIAKANEPITAKGVASDYGDMMLAGQHALLRGEGEAVGLPVDTAATGIAGLFGDHAKQATRTYLHGLDERHPVISTMAGLEGNVAGAVGAAAMLKAPGGIGAPASRGLGGLAARMAYGGAENVVQATTKDVNEASLGDHTINGEKLLAAAPERFLIGAAFTGAFEGVAHGAGKGISALRGAAVPALETGASRAVGREVGMIGDEGVAAGQRIRGLNQGEIPTSRSSMAGLLEAEQGAQRTRGVAERAGAADALAGTQTAEAGALSMRQEAGRTATAAAGRDAAEGLRGAMPAALHEEMAAATATVRQVEEHYGALRQTLTQEHAEASQLAAELAHEHAATTEQLAKAMTAAEKHSGIAPKDAEAMASRQAEHETGMAEMVRTRAEVPKGPTKAELIAYAEGRGPKPVPQGDAGYGMRAADIDAENARVENITATGSESSVHEVTRLKDLADQLKTAHKEAVAHVGSVTKAFKKNEVEAARDLSIAGRAADVRIASFQRVAEKEASGLEKKASTDVASFEKGATKEKASLAKEHDRQIKKLPKPSDTTDVDPLVAGMRSHMATQAERPAISGTAGLGAMFSVLHGNPVGAALALGGSFAAGKARGQGNLLAARAMRGLSQQLTSVDAAVRKGTLLIMGRSGARVAGAVDQEVTREAPVKGPSFESISQDLYAAQGNPLILEHRVREAMGSVATDAPQTYTATLEATQRAHAFLLSILPAPQRDPYSLTPQLVHGSVDETTKYDFMRSFATVARPFSIYQDVANKTVTESQVDAIEQVYPTLYAQMRAEVDHQRVLLKEPMDYEREIHIGTLLGLVTNEVLEPDFQDLLAKTYKDKTAQGQMSGGGSQSPSGESKTSKRMMSGSESLEGGQQ